MRTRERVFATLVAVCAGTGFCPALGQSELAKLLAPDGGLEDYFGHAVAISGDTAAVGVQFDDDSGENAGAVHVYRYDGVNWAHQAKLLAADGAPSDKFGASVDIDGDTILIGAPEDDDNGENAGSAYVFHFDGANWTQQAKPLPDDGATDDLFGNSVAVSGDTALIGISGNNNGDIYTGSAYVFHFDGASWTQQAKLAAADGTSADLWDVRVALDGDTAVIAAPYDDVNGRESGSVYVFRRDDGSWSQQQKIVPTDGDELDFFGWSADVAAAAIVVGAYCDEENGDYSGSAYVFRSDGASWTQEAKLTAWGAGAFARLGTSVAIVGDTLVLGAPYVSSARGSAYVFLFDGSEWIQRRNLYPSDTTPGALSGSSVGLSGNLAVIGAHRNDDDGSNSGSAYVFHSRPCAGDFDGDGEVSLSDLAELLGSYGTASGASYDDGDYDGDGDVDLVDLRGLLLRYGTECE